MLIFLLHFIWDFDKTVRIRIHNRIHNSEFWIRKRNTDYQASDDSIKYSQVNNHKLSWSPPAILSRLLLWGCNFKNYWATNSGSPEVELRFCPWLILLKDWTGWPAWPELSSLSLLCVSQVMANDWEVAFFWPIAFNHLSCDNHTDENETAYTIYRGAS